MALSRNEKVRCGWCFDTSNLGEWSDLTYSECRNREMKRLFVPLTERGAFKRNSKSFYKCPKCGKWLRGSQLKIIRSNDKSLESLGGEAVQISITRRENEDNNN